jgi:hypothetical protein
MKKIFYLILLIFVASGIGCSSNLTGETEGYIKTVAIDRDVKTSKRKTSSNKKKMKTTVSVETEIEYSYNVNGRNYEGYSEKDGNVQGEFQTGGAVVVCYNPSNPEESDVFAKGTKCGG